MLKESPTEGINVRIWVLDLSNCAQNGRDSVKAGTSQVTDVVILDVPVSKALQMHEPRISVSQHSVSIARDNSACLKSLANELLDDGLVGLLSLVEISQLSQPLEAFLVGKTVKRSSESIHGCGVS